MGTLQESDIFHGVQFSVDFAASSNLSFKEKQEIRREIVNNGGILTYILTKQVGSISCLVIYPADYFQVCKSVAWEKCSRKLQQLQCGRRQRKESSLEDIAIDLLKKLPRCKFLPVSGRSQFTIYRQLAQTF